MWFWITGGIVIVVALFSYALHLQLKIRRRDRQRVIWRREVEQVVQQRTDDITNSITVIASAMLAEQMSLSECCIRLSSLLNQLGPVSGEDRFLSIHKAAEELAHIPILEQWKQLKFRQQMRYMKEMDAVETKYRDFVLETCRNLQQQGLQPQTDVGYYQP